MKWHEMGPAVLKFSNSRLARRWREDANRPFSVRPDQRKSNCKGDKARKWMRTDVFNELRATKASHSFSCYRVMCSVRSGGEKRRSHSRCKHTCNPSTDFVLVLGPPVGLYIVMIKRKQRAEMQESQAQAQRQGTALDSGEKWPHLRHLLYHSRITNSTSEFKAGAPFRAPYRASKYSSKIVPLSSICSHCVGCKC